jgi:hypothetical protein
MNVRILLETQFMLSADVVVGAVTGTMVGAVTGAVIL